ncbi:hypothetical protein HDU81_000460 [Chytriomyces hyalinus]|nr:hypothetical protein HDU81_000460 [Chytriomyces hyalinus]
MEAAHGQHSGQGDGARYPLYGTGVGVGVGVGVGGAALSVDTAAHTHSQNHPATQTQPQSQPPAHLHQQAHSQQSPLDRPAQQQHQQQQQQANSTGSSTLNLINLMGNTANMQMASMSGILSQHSHPNPYSMQYSTSASQNIAFPSDLIHQQTQPQPRQSLHLQPLQKHSLQDVSSFSPVDQTSSVTSFESPTTANPVIAPAADAGSEAGSPTEGNMMTDMNRRNYFQLSSSFSITESATEDGANYASISGQGNSAPSSTTAAPAIDTSATPPSTSKYFLEIKERLVPITNFLTHMSAYASSSTDGSSAPQGPVELVQHTSKRDKGELTQPVPRVTDKDQRITFERIQFRTATSNNGRRRMGDQQQQPLSAGSNGTSVSGGPLAQQFFIVVVEVLCKVASGEFYKVCESEMDRGVVVRGRAPGHYVARDQGSMGIDSRKLSSAGGTPRLSAKRSIKGVEAAVSKVEQQQQQQLDTGYVNFGSMVNQQNTPRAQPAAQQQIPTGLYPQQQQRPNQYQSQPQTPASMPLPSPISRPPTIPELMVAQERERVAAHAKQNTSQMYTSFYGNGGGMQQTSQQRPVLQQQQLQQLHPYGTASQHTQQLQHLQQPHQQQQQQYPSFMQQHQPHQQTQPQLQQPQQQQSYPYQQQHRPGPAPQQQTHSSAINLGFGFPSQPQTAQHAYPLLPQQPPLQHQHHQQTQQQQQQQQLYPSAQYSQYSPGYSQMQLQLQYQQQQHRNQVAQFQQQQHMRQQQHADQIHAQTQAAVIAEAKTHSNNNNSTGLKPAALKEADFDEESEEFEEPDDSDDDYKPRGGSRGGSRGGRGGGRLKR